MEKSIVKKYFTFSLGIWLNLVISFISTPVTSYLVSPDEFGKSSLFLTMYSLVLTVVMFGTLNSLMRFYYKKEDKSTLFYSCIIIPFIWIAFLSIPLLFFIKRISVFFEFQSYSLFAFIVLGLLIFGVIQQYVITLLRVQQKGLAYSALSVSMQGVNLFFVIFLCNFVSSSFYSILVAQVISYFVVSLIGLYLVKDSIKNIQIDWKISQEAFKYGYPFVLTNVILWIISGTDKIMIRIYNDFSQLGLYSTASKLMTAMVMLTNGFNIMWYPYIYEKYEKDREAVRSKTVKIFNYVSFLVIGIALLIMLSKDLIFLMFAERYRRAADISPFLLTYPPIITMATIVGRAIDFSGKTFWFILSDTFGAIVNVLLNFLLIPVLGARGAAVASGISYFTIFISEFIISQKLFYINYNKSKLIVGLSLLYLSAFINTFTLSNGLSYVANIMFLIFLIILYNEEVLNILKAVKQWFLQKSKK